MPRHLFLDNEEIESYEGLRRKVNPPVQHDANPLVKPDRPWERGISHYGTVRFDEEQQLFRLWYFTNSGRNTPIQFRGRTVPGSTSMLCYATSTDGIHWEKPNLGQVDFEGSTENNIIAIGHGNVEGVAVVDEPDDPDPQRRYKALFWNQDGPFITQPDGALMLGRDNNPEDGIWVSFSPDGIRWTDYEKNPVHCASDCSHYVVKDPSGEKYLAYGRWLGLKVGPEWQRRVAVMESRNFTEWSKGITVMEADQFDEMPMPDTQIYGMTVDTYEGLYIGGVWMYHRGRDHTMDTQLAVSRDGTHWARVGDNDWHRRPMGRDPIPEDLDRQVWLSLGPEGSGYAGMIRPAANFITRGDEIYIYIGLVEGRHSDLERKWRPPPTNMPNCLGLAIQRRDGFVSLDAGAHEGQVTTKPFTLPAADMHLNADASGGTVRAELLDPGGERPSVLAESHPLQGDHLGAQVNWQRAINSLAGRPVKLRLRGTQAKMYSYWFA